MCTARYASYGQTIAQKQGTLLIVIISITISCRLGYCQGARPGTSTTSTTDRPSWQDPSQICTRRVRRPGDQLDRCASASDREEHEAQDFIGQLLANQ
eukprot:3180346-Rhodomonas_salina.1